MARIGPNPVQLGAAESTIYTVTVGQQSRLLIISLLNLDSAASRTPEIYIVPSGQALAVQYRVVGGVNGIIGYRKRREYVWQQYLAAGDTVRWLADVGSVITGFLGAEEKLPDAAGFRNVNAQFLLSTTALLLTVSGTRQATRIDAILHNTDTVDRIATIYYVPAGGSPANSNVIEEKLLKPGETYDFIDVLFRAPSTEIHAKADVANKVVIKLSVREETV